jgi:hypothetical protein
LNEGQKNMDKPGSPENYGPLNVRNKTRQVVDHHYDEAKQGKPLYLLIPGGLIALASLVLIVVTAYAIWIKGSLPQVNGVILLALLAPVYIGGVFLFSYGYELYNLPKALRLTAIILFLTVAAVVILAVLLVLLGGMGGEAGPQTSRSSRSKKSVGNGAGQGSGGFGFWPIFLGGWGFPGRNTTPQVTREEPAEAAPPQPVECPFCSTSYVPEENNYICPNCGAATPQELMPQKADLKD